MTESEATLVVGCATLVVTTTALVFGFVWRWKSRRAKLVIESVELYKNPNAPSGWQVTLSVRNVREATANYAGVWIDDGVSAAPRRSAFHNQVLKLGEGGRETLDLPRRPGTGTMRVMLDWEDTKGKHQRDSGIDLGAPGSGIGGLPLPTSI